MKYFSLLFFVLLFAACGSKNTPPPEPPVTDVLTPNSIDPNEKRFALVIGNASYPASPLKNPANDADLVSQALKDVRFEVTKVKNADRATMLAAVHKFVELLTSNPSSVGLFYYAGHGLEIGGTNYLLPTDVNLGGSNADLSITDNALKLQDLVANLENAHNRMNMVFLDACRNSPNLGGKRGVGARGMTTVATNSEIFVGFSTAQGQTAEDGDNTANSPFSTAFAALIKSPKEVSSVYKDITAAVIDKTNNKQRPWLSGSVRRDFYFVPAQAAPTTPPADPIIKPAPQPAPDNRNAEKIRALRSDAAALEAGGLPDDAAKLRKQADELAR